MDRIIRLQSNQTGNFTETNNIVSFKIPPAVYDMTGSYLQLNSSVVAAVGVAGDNLLSNAMFDFSVQYDGDDETVNNVVMVRRSSMRTGRLGVIEDRLRNDVLEQNLNLYTHAIDEHDGQFYKQLVQPFNFEGTKKNPYIQYEQEGSIASSLLKNVPINIPLSQLTSLGTMAECPIDAMGGATLELELQPHLFTLIANTNIPPVPPILGATGNDELEDMTQATGGNQTIGIQVPFVLSRDFSVAGSLSDSPLYVGACITIVGTVSEATPGTPDFVFDGANRVVASISVDKSTGIMTVTTTSSCGDMPTGTSLTNPTWSFTDFTTAPQLQITSAEIVLKKVTNPPPISKQLTYTCYETEQLGVAGTSSLNHTFRLPANCFNALIMLPATANQNNAISSLTELTDYRLSIDNIPVVNRRVNVGNGGNNGIRDTLHYDLIGRSLELGGYRLGNLTEVIRANDEVALTDQFNGPNTTTRGDEIIMIGCPTIPTNESKLLQLELNADGDAIESVIVFKQLIKTVNL
tara:strand:+ start:1008 stop:2570 length:1563 start_codon:yes stop_codon:yes gene_type:complete